MATDKATAVAKKTPPRAPATKRVAIGPTQLQPRFADAQPEGMVMPAAGHGKQKLMRDSFTIPKNEYESLAILKMRALGLGRASKKSEFIRAGIATLVALTDVELLDILDRIPVIKTGRPSKAEETTKTTKRKG